MLKIILPLFLSFCFGGAAVGQRPLIADTTGLFLDAMVLEHSLNFTDLYMIRTTSKNRQIVIYCNTAYCYKQRNANQNA